MSLHSTLTTILTEYPKASTQPFGGNPLAGFIRDQAAEDVQNALGDLGVGLVVEGSAGAGNWALVPWISVFDPAITTSATKGYYVVYLFHVNQPTVHLSFNQGTTSVCDEFGSRAREILRDRAELIRKRIADYGDALPATSIELGSNARLPGDYAAGHAVGVSYDLTTLPEEAVLRSHLQTIVRAYRSLTFRGGIDADAESQTDLAEDFGIASSISITETRRYAYHPRSNATQQRPVRRRNIMGHAAKPAL